MTSDTSQLLRAADAGDVEKVREALATHGVNVDETDELLQTALCKAAVRGHLDVVNLLLEADCDVHVPCRFGWSALGYAIGAGHAAVAQRLIAAGASVDNIGNGESALMCAIRPGRLDLVDMLLALKVNVNVVNEYGGSALTVACLKNQHGVVKKLLLAGADVGDSTKRGATPLSTASRAGFEKIVATLLSSSFYTDEHRDKIKACLPHALSCAIESEHVGIVRKLLAAGATVNQVDDSCENPPLICAAQGSCVEIVRILILNGANVNATNDCNDTALTLAARRGSTTIVEMLLAVDGILIEHTNNDGDTALLCAAARAHVGVFHLLIAAGANVHHANKKGETALLLASRSGQVEIVETLLALGVAVDVVSTFGATALCAAIYNGNVYVVEKLLSMGKARVTDVNSNGDSALVVAARDGNKHLVDLLLAYDADVNDAGALDTTALDIASAMIFVDVVRSLLEAGADVNRPNQRGLSPFHRAALHGHVPMLEILVAYGADVNATTAAGDTAMTLATAARRTNVVTWLTLHTTVDNDPAGDLSAPRIA